MRSLTIPTETRRQLKIENTNYFSTHTNTSSAIIILNRLKHARARTHAHLHVTEIDYFKYGFRKRCEYDCDAVVKRTCCPSWELFHFHLITWRLFCSKNNHQKIIINSANGFKLIACFKNFAIDVRVRHIFQHRT